MSLLEELKAVEPGYSGISAWSVLDEVDNVEMLQDEHTGEGRWESYNTAVFFREGDETPYVALDYSSPLTEVQEGQDQSVADFYEVKPVQVTVTKYEKV